MAVVAVCFIYFFRRQQRVDKGQFSSLISVNGGSNPSASLSEISLHSHSKHGSRVLSVSYDVDNEPEKPSQFAELRPVSGRFCRHHHVRMHPRSDLRRGSASEGAWAGWEVKLRHVDDSDSVDGDPAAAAPLG